MAERAAPARRAPRDEDESAATLRAPRSCGELFRVFNRLALRGFGGVLPVAHRTLVDEERWLTPQQFVELLALSQVLPGPNVINMALIYGDRHHGWRGALAASTGLLTLPLLIVLALALGYQRFAAYPPVSGALRGMGAVAAGLVVSTAVKLAPTLKKNPIGRATGALLAAFTLAGVGLLRWPMVWVVLGLGSVGTALAWRGLRREEQPQL